SRPGPVAEDGIEDGDDDEREAEVSLEAQAVAERADEDVGRRRGERDLQTEERERGRLGVDLAAEEEAGMPDDAARRGAEEEGVAADPERHRREEDGDELGGRRVGSVLGPRQARLEGGEPALHEEDERGGEDEPDDSALIESHRRAAADVTSWKRKASFVCAMLGRPARGQGAGERGR